jgi:glycine betaine/proline transport system permease protein
MDSVRIPLGQWVEALIDYLRDNWGPFFNIIRAPIAWVESMLRGALLEGHPLVLALMLAGMVWAALGRRLAAAVVALGTVVWIAGAALGQWGWIAPPAWSAQVTPFVIVALLAVLAWRLVSWQTALFTLFALALIGSLELWALMIRTLSLTLTATFVALLLAIPTGILIAKSDIGRTIVNPVLDFMQTMPAYVYLLPAIMLFGLGSVPAVIGTIIFAFPPPVRLTYLGLRQVPKEMVEAADAFGCTPLQKLVKVEIPSALPSIMAGVNQCLLLSLSMVVIASLIGAEGLGTEVLRGLQRLLIGRGFEAGLGIVILAIILDRLLQGAQRTWQERKRKRTPQSATQQRLPIGTALPMPLISVRRWFRRER